MGDGRTMRSGVEFEKSDEENCGLRLKHFHKIKVVDIALEKGIVGTYLYHLGLE